MRAWPELSDVADELLRARAPEGCSYERLLVVTLSGSFPGRPVTTDYGLYSKHEAGKQSHVLTVSTWKPDGPAELDGLSSDRAELEAQITQREQALRPRLGVKLQRELEALSIPVQPKDPLYGCDGCMITVELGSRNCGMRVWWWESAPECWKALGAITTKLMALGGDPQLSLLDD